MADVPAGCEAKPARAKTLVAGQGAMKHLDASEATTPVPPLTETSATLSRDRESVSAPAVETRTSQASPVPASAVARPPSLQSYNSRISLSRSPVLLMASFHAASFAGGSAAIVAASARHHQSNAVVNSIVRSSTAISLTTPTTTSMDPCGEYIPTQQHALVALKRAVNHVHTRLHQGSVSMLTESGSSEEERTAYRIAQVARAVMQAAGMIDQEDMDGTLNDSDAHDTPSKATATRCSCRQTDWRDDDDFITSPNIFLHLDAAQPVRSNCVMEYIVAKGRAAHTSEELTWLYRHSQLTSLLNPEDLQHLVPLSLHREYTHGEPILDCGAPVRHLYVVVWGNVEVFRVDSINDERKAMEEAFRVASHQSVSMKLSRTSDRRGSLSPYGLRLTDVQGTNTNSEVSSGAIYTHVADLYPGQVFGIENCVFNAASHYVFRAGSAMSKTAISLLPYEELQSVLARNPRFAQGVGVRITDSMDVFGSIREFCRYVFSPTSAQNEYLPLWSILESYTRIHNVIHTKLFSHQVDTGTWGYALNRLPENLTSTFCFDLVHALPPFIARRMQVEARAADTRKGADSLAMKGGSMRSSITYIRTKERRRCTWHLGMEGKTLVLLRDGFTDLLDFLTMLCAHIIESNKLRGRVQGMVHPPAIDILDEYLRQREQEELAGKYLTTGGVTRDAEMQRVHAILKRMPLTEEEQAGLMRNWGHNTLLRIYEVMMHREEYNVRVDPSLSMKFQMNPFHEWALNLRSCVLEKLGLDRFSALPDNLYIDVISSNTHCIKNLLCGFNRKYRKEILDYACRTESKRLGRPEEWHNVDDMLYVALTGFLQNERPDLKEEHSRSLEEDGITVLQDTAMTGLQVEVIPVHQLNFNAIDETIREAMHKYYEEVTKNDSEKREGKTGGSTVPTWAQVCKPIYRRSQDGSKTHVLGCIMTDSRGDTSPNDSDVEPGSTNLATASTTKKSTFTEFSEPANMNSNRGNPTVTPAVHHVRDGRLQWHFLINMDFAFGAQAEGICRVIFSAFGKRIRSVSVVGKAGGLTGKRGDIQLASHVLLSKSSLILEDNQDELRNCRNQDLTAQRLQELAGPRVKVHHGKVLTVTGTMLQNVQLLRYYQQVWRCVGTEMEGSYFARVIEDFYRQGIAHPGLTSRFAYYTSDLPLAQNDAEIEARQTHRLSASAATLSAPMSPQEGVPPLYAIARGILEKVLM
nr:unnamed protein product [Leishmania braziliensis]